MFMRSQDIWQVLVDCLELCRAFWWSIRKIIIAKWSSSFLTVSPIASSPQEVTAIEMQIFGLCWQKLKLGKLRMHFRKCFPYLCWIAWQICDSLRTNTGIPNTSQGRALPSTLYFLNWLNYSTWGSNVGEYTQPSCIEGRHKHYISVSHSFPTVSFS